MIVGHGIGDMVVEGSGIGDMWRGGGGGGVFFFQAEDGIRDTEL